MPERHSARVSSKRWPVHPEGIMAVVLAECLARMLQSHEKAAGGELGAIEWRALCWLAEWKKFNALNFNLIILTTFTAY